LIEIGLILASAACLLEGEGTSAAKRWFKAQEMVESGIKQFKAHFTGPGMRWSRSGAERLLPVRSAIMSRRFELGQAYILPPN